jgi:hypothetical protein
MTRLRAWFDALPDPLKVLLLLPLLPVALGLVLLAGAAFVLALAAPQYILLLLGLWLVSPHAPLVFVPAVLLLVAAEWLLAAEWRHHESSWGVWDRWPPGCRRQR